jgi:hypothetical protein
MIIGIVGLIGSGKGTVADILVKEHDFKKISFADALKDGVAAMFSWPRHLLEGDTVESREWRETPNKFWTQETGKDITPRLVLQLVGTECMRGGFYDGIWVSLVKKKLLTYHQENWVIPDTRFPNEIDMIHSLGGKIWRIKRGEDPTWFGTDNKPEELHPSEFEWTRSKFDTVITNNENFSELEEKVKSLILNHP